MKSVKFVTVSVVLALIVFCGVWSASCSKNACKGVVCLNYGTCSGGLCSCDSGLGGPTCAIIYRNLYANTYVGNGIDDTSHQYINDSLTFTIGTDTSNFNIMGMLTWVNPGGLTVAFPEVILSNNVSSGSSFTAAYVTIDSVIYTASGSVNSNAASISIVETNERPNIAPVVVTFSNLNAE